LVCNPKVFDGVVGIDKDNALDIFNQLGDQM
jgi:hypothetical protein